MQMTTVLIVPDLFYCKQHFKSTAGQDYDHIVYAGYKVFLAMSKRLDQDRLVAVDIETTSIDPSNGHILLSTWHFPKSDYLVTIIHSWGSPLAITEADFGIFADAFSRCTMIAHNAGFEYKWLSHYGLPRPQEIWCTMVADQKLTQGMNGFRYNIVDTLNRRGIRHQIVKDVRETFSGIVKYTDIELEHLLYNRDDTTPLHKLYNIQQFLMRSLNQEFWIARIHMPLVMILIDMEVEGLVLDTDKWTKSIVKAETELEDLDRQLHNLVGILSKGKALQDIVPFLKQTAKSYNTKKDRLKDRISLNRKRLTTWNTQGKTHIKAYQVTLAVMKRAIDQYKALTMPELKVNWGSTDQVLTLMRSIGFFPLPVGKSATTHKFQYSLSKSARQSWLINNPHHKMKDLIVLLDRYLKQAKQLNSFGRGFIEKYLRDTGKVHTSYKQGTVATGRLASGSADSVPATFNSQQLPAKLYIRECFGTDPGYLVATYDLKGAELITMCSLAQDLRLLELSQGDMHSFFANKGWTAIYRYRGLTWTDIINKEHPLRVPYKNMLFGTIYGLKPAKAGDLLNITSAEGRIAIDTIISEIPETIKMVKAASAEALAKGWVLHNTRTNSRRWFRPVIDLMIENRSYSEENQKELSNSHSKMIASAARNTRIQGTQADMLNEAMVLLDRYIKLYRLDSKILLQVHDELVVKFHGSYKTWFPDRLGQIMTRTANKYLDNVKMNVSGEVELTWTK